MIDIMDYDPNKTRNYNKQLVRLTFGIWTYRKTIEVEVKGNISGLEVIKLAIYNVYENLPADKMKEFDEDELVYIEMYGNNTILRCDDDNQEGEDWLEDMLISAEILSLEEEK